MGLSTDQRNDWEENGYFIVPGFAGPEVLAAMIRRVGELVTGIVDGTPREDLLVVQEAALADNPDPENRLSKVFRLMRTEPVFRGFETDPELLGIVGDLLGADIDCFLSQFIFKHPGALGQPWHQDSFYFRMQPSMQVGVWLACTEATVNNGPLWVAPGSHLEAIHEAVKDERVHANPAYVEIVDADVAGATPVLMNPGDLLVFHSHLRHKSTDNEADDKRAAMVYHYALEQTEGYRGYNHDWVEVLRGGEPVSASTEPTPVVF